MNIPCDVLKRGRRIMKSARQNQVLVFYTGNGEIRTLHSDNRRADNMLRDFPEEWIGTYGPESTLDMFIDDYVSWINGGVA